MSVDPPPKALRRPSFFRSIGSLLKRPFENVDTLPQTAPTEQYQLPHEYFPTRRRSLQDHPSNRRPIPSLPRPQTFRRQESEKREKLLEVQQDPDERRALSADRRRGLSASAAGRPWSPKHVPVPLPFASAPDVILPNKPQLKSDGALPFPEKQKSGRQRPADLQPLHIPDRSDGEFEVNDEDDEREIDLTSLQEEYDQRWILNLSMHFRDKSDREKFFVTYAEKPNYWRRITISLDYRIAPEGSLEADLKSLHYQRDKSFRIYEAIRDSLPDIQYYDTVTNLKLATTPEDGQLHVHVREDANETVQYPSTALFQHVQAQKFPESELEFISHLSGFVYKVRAAGTIVIKKEIPGPDTVDEFLYEVNALDSLLGCANTVQLEGLVTDDSGSVVKGLLISYASRGALVDMIYDFRGTVELPWHRREKWAKQIVHGLSEIHEAGFVQGDFTLSNIVIDDNDDAQIIDINRRGCPVGWEPPELGRLIESGQRIGMCISVKTDLYQLGMVLWALAEEVDEPDRVERPLPPIVDEAPEYYRQMVTTCLSPRPQGRSSAKTLLHRFPPNAGQPAQSVRRSVDFSNADLKHSDHSMSTSHRSDKEYIDPKFAMTIDDVRTRRTNTGLTDFTSDQVTYVDPNSNPASTSYRFESSGSWVVGHRRGRSPGSSRRRRSSPYARAASSATSVSGEQSPAGHLQRGPICGSEFSGEDNVGERTVTIPYPPEIGVDDLETAVLEVKLDDKAPESDAYYERHTFEEVDHSFDGLRDRELRRLMHTDSGFDEQMIDDVHGPAAPAQHGKQLIGDVAAAMPSTAPDELFPSGLLEARFEADKSNETRQQ